MPYHFQALQNNIPQTKPYYQVITFNIMLQQCNVGACTVIVLQLILQTHNTFVLAYSRITVL